MELEHLEQSLLEEGCRDPLILWDETIVDGHNRYMLCTQHQIPFDTIQKEFEDKKAAMIWMLKNQLARRNVADYMRTRVSLKLRDLLEPVVQESHREGSRRGGKASKRGLEPSKNKASQPVVTPSTNRNPDSLQGQIAKAAGVSHETVRKVETIEEKGDEETKQQAASGQISIAEAYRRSREGRKAGEPREAFTAEAIKSVKDARFTTQDASGKTRTLSRKVLLDDHDFVKCLHCKGHGIVKKGK